MSNSTLLSFGTELDTHFSSHLFFFGRGVLFVFFFGDMEKISLFTIIITIFVFLNSLLSSIIIIVPKNVYILLSLLLLSVYEQMRVSIFFFFLLKFLRFF